MDKVLIISYYYSYKNMKSTAISIDSRIYGIKDKYKIDIITVNNPDSAKEENVYNIKTQFDVGTSDCINEFITGAMKYYKKNYKKYDVVIVHTNTEEMFHIPSKIKEIRIDQKIIGYAPDPMINTVIKSRKLESVYSRLIHSELLFYNNCDKVIVTNDLFKKHIVKYHNIDEEKLVVIEHSYKKKVIAEDNTYNFVYMGSTYFGRKIDNLCLAFDKFISLDEKNKKYKLVISVTNRSYFTGILKQIKNIDNFIFVEKINFNKAQKIESSAFVNINLTLPIEDWDDDLYFPTKLAQFFSYDRPILTISDHYGVSSKLMEETNNYYTSNSIDEIIQALCLITSEELKVNLDVYDAYSSKSKRKLFINVINDVINR